MSRRAENTGSDRVAEVAVVCAYWGGSGWFERFCGAYGWVPRDEKDVVVLSVPASLLREVRDSIPDGNGRALLTRVIEVGEAQIRDLERRQRRGARRE